MAQFFDIPWYPRARLFDIIPSMIDQQKRSILESIPTYIPGKSVESLQKELGLNRIIKMASNENPLGPSPKAVEVMKSTADQVNIYPDGGGWKLRNAIADKFSLSMDNVILGNGSNEIIEFIGHAFLGDYKVNTKINEQIMQTLYT